MRIRKNSKRVLVEGEKSSLIICQLNRSPWDIDSFFTQGEWDNDLPFKTSFSNSNPPSDSIESMELSFEYVEKTPSQSEREKDSSIVEIGCYSDILPPQQTFSPAQLPPKNVAMPPIPASNLPKKRGRPRKSATGAVAVTNSNINNKNGSNNNENPYEFYYYSGFGPSWSKQRGGSKSAPDNGNGNEMEAPGCSSTTRESSMSDYDDDDENSKNKGDNGVMMQSFDSVLAAERELDYIGDEEEEDEDDLYAGKRAGKPIKARSLKSLM